MRIIKVKPAENRFTDNYDDFVSIYPIDDCEPLNYYCPIPEFSINERIPCYNNIVNNVKIYMSTNILKYTDWIDSAGLKSYYYFIQNFGNNDVNISLEISPDKNISLTESGSFRLNPSKTLYLQPNRDSRFIRLTYINKDSKNCNPIKVWLQGKK